MIGGSVFVGWVEDGIGDIDMVNDMLLYNLKVIRSGKKEDAEKEKPLPNDGDYASEEEVEDEDI